MTSELITHCDICKRLIENGEPDYFWKIERIRVYVKFGDVCENCISKLEKLLNIEQGFHRKIEHKNEKPI